MKAFIGTQISRFFNSGKWALKLIFLVVIVELGIVVGAIATQELDENDSNSATHLGLDLPFPQGTPLRAMGDGVVSVYQQGNVNEKNGIPRGRGEGWGLYLVLKLTQPVEPVAGKKIEKIIFCHLSQIVKRGTVKKNEIIALSGGQHKSNGSGNSNMPHLHLECGPDKWGSWGNQGGATSRFEKHKYRFDNEFVYDPKLILKYPTFGNRVDEYED